MKKLFIELLLFALFIGLGYAALYLTDNVETFMKMVNEALTQLRGMLEPIIALWKDMVK